MKTAVLFLRLNWYALLIGAICGLFLVGGAFVIAVAICFGAEWIALLIVGIIGMWIGGWAIPDSATKLVFPSKRGP